MLKDEEEKIVEKKKKKREKRNRNISPTFLIGLENQLW